MGRAAYSRFVCVCGEACVMVPHVRTGKLAPITVAEKPDGNVVVNMATVVAGHGTYRTASPTDRAAEPLRPYHLNHFASCPSASQFRRR